MLGKEEEETQEFSKSQMVEAVCCFKVTVLKRKVNNQLQTFKHEFYPKLKNVEYKQPPIS